MTTLRLRDLAFEFVGGHDAASTVGTLLSVSERATKSFGEIMLGQQRIVTFVATVDGERARRFYEGTLGLKVISDDGFALAVAADGAATMLRIQKVESFRPHPFTALGWQVRDIAGTVIELQGRGVVFERFEGLAQDDAGVWTAPSGTRVAWFKDPDGNVLSVSQG